MQKYGNIIFKNNFNNMESIKTDIPLFNIEAEMYVIGAILKKPENLNKIAHIINMSDIFYLPEHQLIWKAILSLQERKLVPSKDAVIAELQSLGVLQEIGKDKIEQIVQGTVSTENIETFAKIVREKYDMRRIAEVSDFVMKNIGTVSLDVLEAKIKNVFASVYKEKKQSKDELLKELIAEIENPASNNLMTGFAFLDNYFEFKEGTMHIIASRPGVGKTTLALNIALNLALKDIKVSFASLEMTEKELINRLSTILTKIPIKKSYSDREKKEKIAALNKIINSLPIRIEDNLPPTLYSIESFIDKEKSEGSQLIFIDHLQLLHDPVLQRRSAVEEISSITHNLKYKAQELKIPIVILSQLNRKVEMRENKIPQLSDLRDSGSIEQDADTVTFLSPDKQVPEIINVIIAKNRSGQTGMSKAVFLKEILTFKDAKYLNEDLVF